MKTHTEIIHDNTSHWPTYSFTQVSSDTKSSMNSEQFDTLDSSVAQYDPMLTLSLNLDLPLPLTDN